MKWIVISLFALASVLFAVGKWTRIVGRSADERGGAAVFYVFAAVLLGVDIVLVVGWAVSQLITA